MRFLPIALALLAALASPVVASSANSIHDDDQQQAPMARQLRFGSSAGNSFSFGNVLRATPNPTAPATPHSTTTGPNTTPGPSTTSSPAETPGPSTESPAPGSTSGPSTGGPSTTKSPDTPGPSTNGPSTKSPATPDPSTKGPSTKSPAPGSTPGPSTTNGPSTKSPATPGPSTKGPSTKSPAPGSTPGPSTTNGPSTKSPATPDPSTNGPSTKSPATPDPSTLAPETPSPAPKAASESPAPAAEDDAKTTVVDLLANATVTLDPRFRWGNQGVPANVLEGDNRYQDFLKYPSTALSHCVYNTQFSPYVQIDLGEPKLLYGVTIWHYWGDERQYCSQYLKVSVDGETWTTVFDDGPQYGPYERAEGNHHRFEVQAVRYLRHGAGPSNLNNAVHFMKIAVDGTEIPDAVDDSDSPKNGDSSRPQKKLPLQLVVSGDGERLVATQNGKTFEYDREEEEWNQILKETWFQQVALSSEDLVAGVNGVGQILVRKAQEEEDEEDEWKLLKGDPHKVQEMARAHDRLWAIDEDGKLSYYTFANDQWTSDWFSRDYEFTHIATNRRGTYLMGLVEDGTLFLRKTSTNTWVKQEDLPEEAPKFVRLAIGGSHEVWASAEDGQVYHAWIHEGVPSKLHNWSKVDNRLQQIAPTDSGAIWGVSMDGMGILYCPNRKPKRHAFRCQYVVGPMGAVV